MNIKSIYKSISIKNIIFASLLVFFLVGCSDNENIITGVIKDFRTNEVISNANN